MRRLARLTEETRVALCVQSFGNDMLPATVTNLGNGKVNVEWDNGSSLRGALWSDFHFERNVVPTTTTGWSIVMFTASDDEAESLSSINIIEDWPNMYHMRCDIWSCEVMDSLLV